jgi:uncharacterized protein (TIGR02147 family)
VLFDYIDFREYLREMLAYFRRQDPQFSFQTLVDRYGLRSRSHYIDILNGRKLTRRFLPVYCRICGLKGKEARYFDTLVGYGIAQKPDEKRREFQKLLAMAPNLRTLDLDKEAFEYFEHWYLSATLSALDLDRTQSDHRVIARKFTPKLSAVEVRAALKKLQKWGFIAWDATRNEWIFHRKFLKCTDSARVAAMRPFHRQMQRLGMEAYKTDVQSQSFSTLTLSVSAKLQREIDGMIAELRSKIMEKVKQDDDPELVLQVNLQSFPLTRSKKKGIA